MNVTRKTLRGVAYDRFLLFIAGMGGLLYGIDVGIIAAALLYLGMSVNLTQGQTSIIVAAVLGGGMCSSLVAGWLADLLGRKTMMIFSGVLFVASVGIIVLSQGFVPLFLGRVLQGMSGGFIAVVVPLYLAECLPASTRGRGSAIFQFMLTVGIVVASFVGSYYTSHAETVIKATNGNQALITAAANHAWRSMFLSVVYPGFAFFIGCFFLGETPRWLFGHKRPEAALAALRRSNSEEEALRQFHEMEELAHTYQQQRVSGTAASLLQRKYIVPFVLACVILGCNQATGINSILAYLVIILKQAGMSAQNATHGDVAVKLLNCCMTVVAIALVDKSGRKSLLKAGTAGIIVALFTAGFLFYGFESKRVDVKPQLLAQVKENALTIPLGSLVQQQGTSHAMTLTVAYSYGDGDKVASAVSTDADGVLRIKPEPGSKPSSLTIEHAYYGPVPSETLGWLITGCIALFIASFAAGPGVVVWLALSELMPTRIRSFGMGFALLINQGVSTAIAGVFLPVVGRYGYFAMFWFWGLCTILYFITAAFFLPETKGKTLEEIEQGF